MSTIRILLADDHKMVREGLCSLIGQQIGMEVVAEAQDGREAVQLTRKLRPNLVIMDVTMPGLNGIKATQQILSKSPGVKVIALSMHSHRWFVVRMLDAGASGYVSKEYAFEELTNAIRTVWRGQTYLSPGIASVMNEDNPFDLSKINRSDCSVLTPRQRQVLQLIAEGKSTKETASILNVSVKTVESHRLRIMTKLNTHSIAGLTRYAVREGLTSLDF